MFWSREVLELVREMKRCKELDLGIRCDRLNQRLIIGNSETTQIQTVFQSVPSLALRGAV